jgi:predicted nuclease with TOPRIM domain
MADLARIYNILKGIDPSEIQEIIKALQAMRDRGIGYAEISDDVNNLIASKRRLEDEVASLDSTAGEQRERISALTEKISKSKAELDLVDAQLKSARGEIKKIGDTLELDRERIEASDRFWKLVSSLGIDPQGLEDFMAGPKKLRYDAKAIGSLKMLEKIAFDTNTGGEEITQFSHSLRMLRKHGWNAVHISELSTIVSEVGESPQDAIDVLRSYASDRKAIRIRNAELSRELGYLTDKVAKLAKERDRLVMEMEETRSGYERKLWAEKELLEKEIKNLRNSKAQIETEIREYLGEAAELNEFGELIEQAKGALSLLNSEKLEITREKEKLAKQISPMADIVKFSSGMRALISSHSEEEDYIPLTEAIHSPGMKGKLDYSQRETLRKNMIELFLKLFGSGVAAVDSTNLRFIPGHEYNMFLRYRDKLRHLSDEVNSLERLKTAYGNDVNAILYDDMSGRAVMDAQTRKLVMSLAESALRKQIGVAFDILGVSRTVPGNPDNAIFLTGVSETDSVIQVGAVDVVDLVNFVRSGSEYIMARSKRGGAVRVRTCDAL